MDKSGQNIRRLESDVQHPTSDFRNLVTFRLDRQMYALPIEPIVQIIEMVAVTPIPQVNHSVEGVINVRGTAVPVVNLRRHLSLPEAKLRLHTPLILVQTGERIVGLIVDEVSDVLNISASQIISPTEILPEGLGDAPLLQGLIHTPQGAVLLFDLSRLFSADRAKLVQALAALPQDSGPADDGPSEPPASPPHNGNEPVEPERAGELAEAAA